MDKLKTVRTCNARAKKGTGEGICDAPLDEHGNCPNYGNHLED